MLTEQQLDTFMEEFWEDRHPEHAADTKEEQPEEPEEYRLPTDGLIIRQMTKEGRVSRRTMVCAGCDAPGRTVTSVSVSQGFPRTKISGLQSDRDRCGDASLFYDV